MDRRSDSTLAGILGIITGDCLSTDTATGGTTNHRSKAFVMSEVETEGNSAMSRHKLVSSMADGTP
jgi:hypothetical protein